MKFQIIKPGEKVINNGFFRRTRKKGSETPGFSAVRHFVARSAGVSELLCPPCNLPGFFFLIHFFFLSSLSLRRFTIFSMKLNGV